MDGSSIIILDSGCLEKTVIKLACKGPEENVFYQFSLAKRIGEQTLLSVDGQSNADDISISKITVDGQSFECLISGGTIYHDVSIHFKAITSGGETRTFNAVLPIRPEGVLDSPDATKTVIMGTTGTAGAKGDTGAQGIQGIQGDKGDTGAQGIQGIQGEKGDTGAQGESYVNDGAADLNVKSITAEDGTIKTGKTSFGSLYYNNAGYVDFKAWNVAKGSETLGSDKLNVFVRPEAYSDPSISGYNMALEVDGFIAGESSADPVRKTLLAFFGSNLTLLHDTLGWHGRDSFAVKDPAYYASRLMRIVPQKQKNIHFNGKPEDPTITNDYMAGTIGLATDYFTRDTDGFITPVIWDNETSNNSECRPLGLPYIPASQKTNLTSMENIPVGTQSFDLDKNKSCWWDGAAWAYSTTDNAATAPVSGNEKGFLYETRFDDQYMYRCIKEGDDGAAQWVKIPFASTIANQYVANDGNAALKIKTLALNAVNDTATPTGGMIGINPASKLPSIYNAADKKWCDIVVSNNSNNAPDVSTRVFRTSYAYIEALVLAGAGSPIIIPIVRAGNTAAQPDKNVTFQYDNTANVYNFSSQKYIKQFAFDVNVTAPTFTAADKSSLSTTNLTVGTMAFDKSSGKPCWWNGSAWADAMGAAL